MVKIIRGTTPIIEIQVIGCDLKKYKHILITIQQGRVSLDKTENDISIENDIIRFKLTQDETLTFSAFKDALIQLRAKSDDGNTVASDITTIQVKGILKEGLL